MAVAIVDGGNASSTYTGTLDGGDAFTLFGPENHTGAGCDSGAVGAGVCC